LPLGRRDELFDDRSAESATLVIGVDSDVGDVRTVDTVGERTAGAAHVVTAVDEAREHPVAEYRRQRG
jgi:hypothetical protein